MIILDENISEAQAKLLIKWRVRVRHLGFDLKLKGIKDQQVVTSLLHRNKRLLFVTRDNDFYDRKLCPPNYGIALFEVEQEEMAFYIRKFLKHKQFATMSKRLGKVAKVSQTLISFYINTTSEMQRVKW